MEISKKRIILTGAASGIGKELLNQLSNYDCQIMAVDRNQSALEELDKVLDKRNAKVSAYVCDISRPDSLDKLFEDALQMMGGIDIFIANAGYAYYEKLMKADWERIETIFNVNVHSPIYTALKMKNLHPDTPYKVIVTASAIGKLGLPGYALYGATKSAIDRFAEAFRFELPDPSSLTLVYPIATRTGFFQEANKHPAPLPWPSQTPDKVAKAIIHGILKDRKSIYPSVIYNIFLVIGRIFPPLYRLEQWIELQRFNTWLKELPEKN